MAKAKKEMNVVIHKLYEGKHYTVNEQLLVRYGKTAKQIAMDIFMNRDGRYDHLFEPLSEDEIKNNKESQQRKRARERRAAGGW